MSFDADGYLERLLLYTERLTVDVNDGLSGFLYSLSTEVSLLV